MASLLILCSFYLIHVTQSLPNFVIFLIDDIQFTSKWGVTMDANNAGIHLANGVIKYLDIPTPNIDAFISESVTIPRSYSHPRCSPSRFSLLTGRLPTRCLYGKSMSEAAKNLHVGAKVDIPDTKIWGDDGIYNIPNVLKRSKKYRTGMVGKWHLMTTDDNGHNFGCHDLGDSINATLYEQCTQIVKNQGWNFVDAFYTANGAYECVACPYSHNPEWMISESMKFIDTSINAGKPFFLYFSSTLTHAPSIIEALEDYTAAETPKKVFSGSEIPNNTDMKTRSEILDEATALKNVNNWDPDAYNTAAGVLWVDDTFRVLMDYLKANNVYDDTFIMLMNDHGMGSKNMLMEQGTRIINSIRYPAKFGTTGYLLPQDFVVTTTDVAASVFDLAEIDLSADWPDYVTDSKNFVNDIEEYVVDMETNGQITRDYDIDPPACCEEKQIDILHSHAIISKNYKYIFRATNEYSRRGRQSYPFIGDLEQLYDMQGDPNEQHNLLNGLSLINTDLQDILFKFRIKMWDYIRSDVCLSANIADCVVPKVTYIPPWSTWNPDYTCDSIIPFTRSWDRVRRFNERTKGVRMRQSAEAKWLRNNPNSGCGTSFGSNGDIEYLYDFEHVLFVLKLNMIICCDGSFGSNYKIPLNYQGNEVYHNHTASFVDTKPNLDPMDLTEIISMCAAIVLLVTCVVHSIRTIRNGILNLETQEETGVLRRLPKKKFNENGLQQVKKKAIVMVNDPDEAIPILINDE